MLIASVSPLFAFTSATSELIESIHVLFFTIRSYKAGYITVFGTTTSIFFCSLNLHFQPCGGGKLAQIPSLPRPPACLGLGKPLSFHPSFISPFTSAPSLIPVKKDVEIIFLWLLEERYDPHIPGGRLRLRSWILGMRHCRRWGSAPLTNNAHKQ